MDIEVSCYAGYRGEETPRSIRMGNNSIDVVDIIDRWLAPDYRYFKVLGEDRAIYILRHDVVEWKWDLAFFSYTQTPVHMDKPAGTS